jgi:surface protein
MESMFYNCINFNQPLGQWNVSKVTTMENMFGNCKKFNQPLNTFRELGQWNVYKVTTMKSMFYGCSDFNQPLDKWIVNQVENMSWMFADCKKFNQNLLDWDVSHVTDFSYMFLRCDDLRLNVNEWATLNRNATIVGINEHATGVEFEGTGHRTDPFEVHDFMKKVNYQALFQEIGPEGGFYSFDTYHITNPSSYPFGEIQRRLNKNTKTDLGNAIIMYIRITLQRIITEHKKKNPTEEVDPEYDPSKHFDLLIESERLYVPSMFHEYIDSQSEAPLRDMIFTVLLFMQDQPEQFQFQYVSDFLFQCVNAYDEYAMDNPNRMSCSKGVLERLIFCLPAGSRGMDDPNGKYARIGQAMYGGCNSLGLSTIKGEIDIVPAQVSEAVQNILPKMTALTPEEKIHLRDELSTTDKRINVANYPLFFDLIRQALIHRQLLCVNDPIPESVFTILNVEPKDAFKYYASAMVDELSDMLTTGGGGRRRKTHTKRKLTRGVARLSRRRR